MYYNLSGMTVDVLWDATTDQLCMSVSDHGVLDFREIGPISNNAGAGVTGDVSFTTIGASSNDRYFIMLVVDKKYS